MTINMPVNFGHRQCDRLLVRSLCTGGVDRSELLWMMFLCWQDFATAREDRREVPLDPQERAASSTIAILEEYIGWKHQPGGFIAAGIQSGFFLLTPVTAGHAELILTDFFPANAVAASIGNSERGGVSKSYKGMRLRAEAAASDQLQLFRANGGVQVPGAQEKQIKAAVMFVHGVCLALKRQAPQEDAWRSTILAKAVEVVSATTDLERECVIKWFIKNRQNQRIPVRLDFVLDQFSNFIPEAVQAFGR